MTTYLARARWVNWSADQLGKVHGQDMFQFLLRLDPQNKTKNKNLNILGRLITFAIEMVFVECRPFIQLLYDIALNFSIWTNSSFPISVQRI